MHKEPEQKPTSALGDLSARSREIFRLIVESYLETGEPVGSRTLSQRIASPLSAASIRNVMADLEQMGLVSAPHTSAGRMPTHAGLRLFVDGMMEIGDLSDAERSAIDGKLATHNKSYDEVLTQASALLAGLSHCASLVVAPRLDRALKHVEFVALSPGRALVVMVADDGAIENRVIEAPIGLPPSALVEAANYLNARVAGRTLDEAQRVIAGELARQKGELDALTAKLITAGLATWGGATESEPRALIVRGASQLLSDVAAAGDLERIRRLFDDIERGQELVQLLDLVQGAAGVRIFIGAENKLFSLSGSSVILAPYADSRAKIVGVVGVIGPMRLNYARIIPMVDYTARMIGRVLT